MAVQLRQYIQLKGDNPLRAVITGTHYNAWLVATCAEDGSVDETMAQYQLSRAEVHAALAFYYDNADAIAEAQAENRQNPPPNAVDGWKKLEEIRSRLKQEKSDDS